MTVEIRSLVVRVNFSEQDNFEDEDKAEDRFLLKRYVRRIPSVEAMQLADTLDFENGREMRR